MERQIIAHPASVRRVAERQTELLALVQAHTLDEDVLTDRAPFFWQAEISSNRLDAYFTRMSPSSLRNYAAEAQAGVSFQNSHRHMELPIGRSLTGTYEEGDGLSRVLADFYTVPGLNLNGVDTDDFIIGVRSGIVKDVSIGFYGGRMRCSICGQNYLSFHCPHIAGFEYERRDDEGNVTGMEQAFAWVDDAHLAEVSAVYDGATPGAAILKAQQEADAGRLRPDAARILEARYRIKLPSARRTWPGADTQEEKEKPMDPQAIVDAIRATLGVPEDKPLTDAVRALSDEAKKAKAEVERLQPLADDGKRYRDDLIAEALAEGVRAQGESFSEETYRGILADAPLDTIKRMRDDWKAIGDRRFPGGRRTADNAAPENPDKQKPATPERKRTRLPAAAYKV